MTKYEWATNQHRDTMASHVGHYDQLSYYAVAQNESVGRVRAQMLEKMLEPCGPPPTKKEAARAFVVAEATAMSKYERVNFSEI